MVSKNLRLHEGSKAHGAACEDIRCSDCRKLLAKIEGNELVIRCSRCKHEMRIPLVAPGSDDQNPPTEWRTINISHG